jgi:quercetin dioxygenase-like cupin family protein
MVSEPFAWLAGARIHVVLPGALCADRLSIVEVHADTGYAAATHTHRFEEEVFYVLDGAVTVWAGDQRRELVPGERALLPRGVAHGYRVDTGPARMINVCTPGGLDRFFREVAGGAPFVEVAFRYGITYQHGLHELDGPRG